MYVQPAPSSPDAMFAYQMLSAMKKLPSNFSADTNTLQLELSTAEKSALNKSKKKSKKSKAAAAAEESEEERPAKKIRLSGPVLECKEDEAPTFEQIATTPAVIRGAGEAADISRVLPGLHVRCVFCNSYL
jgi:hypothetical protein